MISRFRFLTDNDEDEIDIPVYDIDPNFASWMWVSRDNMDRDPHWVLDYMLTTSIRTFLSNFPETMIVPVISITGDNITMTSETENNGWPFDIMGGTELYIVYLKWQPE